MIAAAASVARIAIRIAMAETLRLAIFRHEWQG
jgi:hypothetical protein